MSIEAARCHSTARPLPWLAILIVTSLLSQETRSDTTNALLYDLMADLYGATIDCDDRRKLHLLAYARRAEEQAESITETSSNETEAYKDILELTAWAHLKIGGGEQDYELGREYLEKFEERFPDEASIPFMKGAFVFINGEAKRSKELDAELEVLFERTVAIDPHFVEAYWLLSQVRALGEFEQVAQDRRKYLELYQYRRPVWRLFKEDDLEGFNVAREWLEQWESTQRNRK